LSIRYEQLEGKQHAVVPMVMLVEGVLNGSQGPLFYPAKEIQRSVAAWNGRPVVVYHPDFYGGGIAGNPDVFNRQKVGTIFNAKYANGRLVAEAWIDIERADQVDGRVLDSIRSNRMMELSTGLFTDRDDRTGAFNGRNYDGIATNYRPDHLALLPDTSGACSLADGCGLLRVNELAEEVYVMPPVFA
jgi:hypothetical protein